MINLDHNATTQPLPEVVAAVRLALEEHWHNPSSVHRGGQNARRAVELAREAVATLIRARPKEIILTSGGTESIDTALRGTLAATGKRAILTTAIEHAAIRDLTAHLAKRGECAVRALPLDRHGLVDPVGIKPLLTPDVALVSVQWANNETGVIQPVQAIGALCRGRGIAFHCDATQWVGKMPVEGDPSPWCDLLTFSPHKWHGPKGVGVLWVRSGVRLVPMLHGSQEQGRRAGTENVPGIVGAGVAAAAAGEWLSDPGPRARLAALRDAFERAVMARVPGAIINGAGAPRLWNTTNIAFPRLEAEALLMAMSERGLFVSAGAACSSGSLDPSPVLLALGIAPDVAAGSIRFSLSRFTTQAEMDQAVEVVVEAVRRVGGSMPSR